MAGYQPRLMILDEPTQGIDVRPRPRSTRHRRPRRQGLAILLISSELPELMGMRDRIMVLREGRLTAELSAAEATQERVLYAMTDAAGAAAGPARHVAVDPAPAADRPASGLRRLVVRRELGLLLAMTAVILPVVAVNPRMLSRCQSDGAGDGCRAAHDRRRRPDAGHPHAQHRPVRSLGPSGSLPTSRPTSCAATLKLGVDRRHPCGLGRGSRLRPAQWARGHGRPRPLDRRHAGHAHALSRLHQPLRRRQAGQRRSGATSLARPDQRQRRRRAGAWC